MRRIAVTAPLIRLAAVDDDYAQDLYDAVVADGQSMEELMSGAVDERDFGQLTPTEWQWYANWRQSLGGQLDQTLLDYLTATVTTRFARFQVRALVLRDPETNRSAVAWNGDPANFPSDTGLMWLRRQADLERIYNALDRARYPHRAAYEAFEQRERSDDVHSWRLQGDEVLEERERHARSNEAFLEKVRRAENEEALELMTDALQCGTHASRFLLTALTSVDDEAHALVQERLDDFADERGLERRWYEQGQIA